MLRSLRAWLATAAIALACWLACLIPEASARPEDLRAKLVRHETPRGLCPGEATNVEVVLLNIGDEPWDPETRDRLAYHWRDAAGQAVIYDGERTQLPEVVAPGESITLQARLVAPEQPGPLRLQWKLVREGVRWVPTEDNETPVEIADSDRPALALSVQAGQANEKVVAGGRFTVDVQVENLGCATLSSDAADNLAYHWLSEDGQMLVFDGQRTPMPTLTPGASQTVRASVRAPEQAGTYRLQWAMVREGLTWVDVDPDASTPTETVTVGEPPLTWAWAIVDPLESLAVAEATTVAVSLTNTGTEAWQAEAGDRLGYRWLDAEGEPLAGEGLRTPLPAVVEPGQTIEVRARVQAPPSPGRFALAWQPVREHVRWFGPPTSGPEPPTVEITPARLAWSLVEIDEPGAVWVGHDDTVTITIQNAGADTWSSKSHADHLSYRWLTTDGQPVDEGVRTVLPHDVAPGETVTVQMRLRGPDQPGRYVLEVDMVREHVRWYGPPKQGQARYVVAASRAAVGVSIAYVFLTVFFVALRRKHLRGEGWTPQRIWMLDRVVLPLWTMLAAGLAGEGFIELGGVPYWEGGHAVAWSCAALVGLLVALLPDRAQAWGAAAASVFVTLLVVADLAYLEFFGSIVPLTALLAFHHLGDAHGTVTSLLTTRHLWVMGLPLSGLLLALTLGPRAARPAPSARWRTRIVVALLLSLAGSHAVRKLSTHLSGRLGARVFSQHDNVGRFGLLGAHLFELARQTRDALQTKEPPSGEARARIERLFAARAEARARPTAVTGKAKGYNLVVLQVEALSSWAMGLEVDGQAITPYLDSIADDAWLSQSIWDQTAQGRTSDAEFLVLSSGHPLAEGALSFRHDDNGFETLVHALTEHGYASLSAHPYARGFWNRAVLHPRYGFADSMFRRELGKGPVSGWGLADGPFLQRMIEPIAALPQPWVTFMITLSLHHPYDSFPAELSELELTELAGTPVGYYLQAMRHFDSAFRRFMQDLEAHGLADHTIVALYGDHVTGIENRRAVWQLAGWDGWSPDVPKRIRRVPLMILAPGIERPKVDPGQPRGQIDIGPTVLDLLGVPAPRAFVGRSLAAPGERPVVLPDGSVVTVERLFVASGRDVPREGSCFDLPSGTTRPRADCDDLVAHAKAELDASRAVVEHDLHRHLGEP